jgi:hypothetical protein
MNDRVTPELVAAATRHIGASSLRSLLCAPAEKISGGELRAVGTHDGNGHVSVVFVHDVPYGILAGRVADLTIDDASVFPGYEPPRADEGIRCYRLPLCVGALAPIMMPRAKRGANLGDPFTRSWRIPLLGRVGEAPAGRVVMEG